MHCPCCCKSGGSIGALVVLGIALYLASKAETILAALRVFLECFLIGEMTLAVVMIAIIVTRVRREVVDSRKTQEIESPTVTVHSIMTAPERHGIESSVSVQGYVYDSDRTRSGIIGI